MDESWSYFNVEVRDDHDGGSVWYIEIDFIDNEEEANDRAASISMHRDNNAARVCKVTSVPLRKFEFGYAKDQQPTDR